MNGEGELYPDSVEYNYPPLWGPHSFNVSAAMYRITKMAGFVMANMPFEKRDSSDDITNEDAWDVSAYILSQPRPQKFFNGDWPDNKTKPFDYPFGPFNDSFSALQHKYGPFGAMKK